MKKVLFVSLFCFGLTLGSCTKSESCKECTDCKEKASATLCEESFEKTSDFEDKVEDYVSDGGTCVNK